MIKLLDLKDASGRPSNAQLKRLTVGDDVMLFYKHIFFWVKIAFIRANDLVGIVIKHEGIEDLQQDDLVSFEIRHIAEVIPDEKRVKLLPFMLVTHHDHKDQMYVLHTKHPRMIAMIEFGDVVKARDAVWIDEPVDYNKTAPELLEKMTDWFLYNYIKKKQ